MMALLAGGSVALGCAHHPPVVRPYAPPTVDVLLAAWRDHQQTFVAMNARARATSWLGGERVRATVLMLVDRGGSLRFEAEVSLQGTVAILATDGRRFGLLDLPHGELRRGPACPANVAALLRIPLAPPDIAAILLGDVRIAGGEPAASTALVRSSWDAERGAEVLSIPSADGLVRVWLERTGAGPGTDENLDSAAWRITGATATAPEGRVRWRLLYEDFSPVTVVSGVPGGRGRARRFEAAQIIRFAEGGASFDDGVEIKFKQRSFNEPAAASAFVLEATHGTNTIDVGCP
jgi:hypothetical protein